MKSFFTHRFVVKRNFPALIGLCLCFYFSWYAAFGDRGAVRLLDLRREIAQAQNIAGDLQTRRTALETRVVRLRPGTLDPDLLEERVHMVLGLYGPQAEILLR